MDREGFRSKLKQYKKAREENPGLKYWEWNAQPAEKDIPKYDKGANNVEKWDPRITAEGYDDKGYYVQAMNPMPEVVVHGPYSRHSEIQRGYTEVKGYPEATHNWSKVTTGNAALELIHPEFDLLTGIRTLPKIKFKSFDFKNKINTTDNWKEWGSESLVRPGDDYYLKIPRKGFKELGNDFARYVRKKLRFNELPENTRVPYTYEGYTIDGNGHYFPIVKQRTVRQHADESINNLLFVDVQNEFKKARYSANTKYAGAQNKWYNVQDYSPNQNIGELNGKGVLFDAILGESYIPLFIKTLKENYKFVKDRPYITGLNAVSENTENFKYAEGGQVQPDPMDVLERSRPKVAGIPINDKPLSGTDPIGEAMMWGLGGGAASVALRSLFPTYGATAAWLAFGDNNDNMLVVPKNPTKNAAPIETGLLNKEVRQYYADDVLPRDILTSEVDKLRFLNTDKNFEYDLYPSDYFKENVAGHYDVYADKIRLNGGYAANKDLLDNVMAHEVNHRYNKQFPLDKEHNRILNRAYTVESDLDTPAARAARKSSEKRATNVNIRHKLQTDLRNTLGHKPTKAEMDKFIDSLSDLELLDRLGSTSAYGAAYLMSIEDRADLVNQPVDQYKKARVTALKKALKRIAMNEDNNDNNQNYA